MDTKTIQPSIDALNAEILRLTAARDTLVALTAGTGAPINKKTPTLSAAGRESIRAAQRKRWAEEKRKQRAKAKK